LSEQDTVRSAKTASFRPRCWAIRSAAVRWGVEAPNAGHPNTLIVVVLDESGSMESKVDDDRRDALNELG